MHYPSAQHAPKHNHLTLSSINMIDCMSNILNSEPSNSKEDKQNTIYQALIKYVPSNCYIDNNIPMGAEYIDDIYLMLINQFETRLSSEVVKIACELYFKHACKIQVPYGVIMSQKIDNPIGFFKWCYKNALKKYKTKVNLTS